MRRPLLTRARPAVRLARQTGWSASIRSAAALAAAGFLAWAVGAAEPPRIDHIECFLTNQVTIHFDTDAHRTYELQFRNPAASSNGTVNGPWTNLFVAPNLPFPNHYIVVDTRTNGARIYRLKGVKQVGSGRFAAA